VTVGDTSFTSLLEEIARNDPEIIYFGGFPAEAARLIQQRADAGLEDVAFIGADGILGTEVVDLAGMDAEGVYASAPSAPTSDALEAFLERYVETYGETPPAPFHANGYDAYNVIMDAIENTATINDDGDLVISRSALAEYIRSIEDFAGLTGRLDADGQGELVSPERAIVVLSQIQDGEFVEIAVVGGEEEEEDEDEESSEYVINRKKAPVLFAGRGLFHNLCMI
jgi:branched-chain amino acid transport system substrate-binding protein